MPEQAFDRCPPLWRVLSLCLLTGVAASGAAASGKAGNSFWAEGSDTGAGLGARYVALGGAGVALADDVYAVFYNPAGLAASKGFEVAVSRQLNARLHNINFLGLAWQLPLAEHWGFKTTVAAAYYPRIHARASGAFGEADFESIFLRYLLPGISGTFDGDIDSKTKSYRLAFGFAPLGNGPWSLGFYIEHIDCKSNFCGVHATSNGFTTSSTGAKAIGAGLGLRYRPSSNWDLALSINDLGTRLTLNTLTTDSQGTRAQQTSAEFPRKIAAGATWHYASDLTISADYELTRGRYGKSELDLQAMRLGAEKRAGAWAWRAGAVVPIRISSSMTGTLKTPFPVSPTLGLGWHEAGLKLDLAVYGHAVMSMNKGGVSPAADLSLAWGF